MQKIFFLILMISLAAGCATTSRTNSEMAIGMVTYDGFESITPPSATDTTYYVMSNDAVFDQLFRSIVDKPVRPNFDGQTAVAVQAPKGSQIIIDRIAIQGHFLNVYAVTCKPDHVHCAPNALAIATAPRSESVRHVRFFFNGVERREVNR